MGWTPGPPEEKKFGFRRLGPDAPLEIGWLFATDRVAGKLGCLTPGFRSAPGAEDRQPASHERSLPGSEAGRARNSEAGRARKRRRSRPSRSKSGNRSCLCQGHRSEELQRAPCLSLSHLLPSPTTINEGKVGCRVAAGRDGPPGSLAAQSPRLLGGADRTDSRRPHRYETDKTELLLAPASRLRRTARREDLVYWTIRRMLIDLIDLCSFSEMVLLESLILP